MWIRLAGCALALALTLQADALQSAPDPLAALCEDLLETAQIPGFSYAVAVDGEVVLADGCGVADLESAPPATPDTQYRMASVSKLATATLTAKLVQRGAFDLDAPLGDYLPEVPGLEGVTARLLMGHLSGLAHYQGADAFDPERVYDNAGDAVEVFQDSPRAGRPGEKYQYSTHGFTLLSAALEAAAGKTFLELLQEEVFDPLAMESSGPDHPVVASPQRASLYRWFGRRNFPIPKPENTSYKWAGGGLISTPTDLVRMGSAYYDENYLEPETVREMFTSQETAAGVETGVGLAWRVGEDFAGRRVVHHAGSMGGARSVLLLVPEERLAIALQTNTAWPSAIESTAQILAEAWRRRSGGSSAAGDASVGRRVGYSGSFSSPDGDDGQFGGELVFEGGRSQLEVAPPVTEWLKRDAVDFFPVHRLGDDLWALVMPLGIYALPFEDGRAKAALGRGVAFEVTVDAR